MATPKRRPKGKRVGWGKLSSDYRSRLERNGVSRAEWESGVDLRRVRGHTPPPPRGAAPAEVVGSVLGGTATRDDLAALREWADKATAPSWTRGLDADVAAALSQIPWPPGKWRDVILTPAADGDPWTMRVVPKGRPENGTVTDRKGNDHAVTAYDVTIEIPGGGEAGSGAKQVMDLLTFGPPEQRESDEWETVNFDLTGTT